MHLTYVPLNPITLAVLYFSDTNFFKKNKQLKKGDNRKNRKQCRIIYLLIDIDLICN